MNYISPWLISGAFLSVLLSTLLWRSFGWRWHAGLVLIVGGVVFGAFTLSLYGVADYFSFGLGYRAPKAKIDFGISIGAIFAGAVIIIISPLIALNQRRDHKAHDQS